VIGRSEKAEKVMFGPKEKITITVKLFNGLDRDSKVDNYDAETGISMVIPKNLRLKKAIKRIGLNPYDSIAFFINGKKAGFREKLNDGDVVFCMRPVFGG